MCGIVGIFGQIGHKEEKIFKQLLEVDSLRGRHSTGVIKVTSDKVVSTKKKAVDGLDFVKLESQWISQGVNRVLIGHNRHATKGAINDVNAHPFTHGSYHGVHNGTLTTQYGLKDHTQFQVDSDNIFYNIAHEGVEKTVPKLKGAFAIAGYDEDNHQVHIFRNNQRELGMVIMNDGKTIIIASEFLMLEWVLFRNDFTSDEYKMVELIDTYKLITLKPFALGKGNITKPISHTVETKKLEKPPVIVTGGSTGSGVVKSLREANLSGTTYYPLEVESVRRIQGHNGKKQHRYTCKLLVPPFIKVNINTYSETQDTVIKNYGDRFEAKPSPAYSPSSLDKDVDFLVHTGETRSLTQSGKDAIEQYKDDNVVPFTTGK